MKGLEANDLFSPGQALENLWRDAFSWMWQYEDEAKRAQQVIVDNQDIVVAGLMIVGGTVAIVGTLGTASPFVLTATVMAGSFSAAAGMAHMTLSLSGDKKLMELKDKIPGSLLDAIVGITVEYTLDGKVSQKTIQITRSMLNISEQIITLDLNSETLVYATSISIVSIQLTEEVTDLLGNELEENESETSNPTDSDPAKAASCAPSKRKNKFELMLESAPKENESSNEQN